MLDPTAQPHAFAPFHRLPFVDGAVIILRQHHVLERRKVGYQVELLKDGAYLSPPQHDALALGQSGYIGSVEDIVPFGRSVETSEDVRGRKN